MRRFLKIIVCFTVLAILQACESKQTPLQSFILDDTVRLEIDGDKVLVFDPQKCQMAYNEQRGLFRVNSDTMLDYFELTIDRIPKAMGNDVTGSIYWSTPNGERNRKNITLNVKRIRGDIIWMCDASQRTALVVRTLK